MRFPKMRSSDQTREFIQEFGGLDRRARIPENCFSDMRNMTGDHYPALASRRPRGLLEKIEQCNGFLVKDELACVNGNTLYYGLGENAITVQLRAGVDVPRKLISMGAYIVVLPDNIAFNTISRKKEIFYNTFASGYGREFTFTLCDENDAPIDLAAVSVVSNENDITGIYMKPAEYWIKDDGEYMKLTGVPDPYFFPQYEVVMTGACYVQGASANRFYRVKVSQEETSRATGTITVKNLDTGETVTHKIGATNGESEIKAPSGCFLKLYTLDSNAVLLSSIDEGEATEIKTRVRISSSLFHESLPRTEGVYMELSEENGEAFELSKYISPLEGTHNGRFKDGSFYVDGVLNQCATFTTISGEGARSYKATLKTDAFVPVMDYVIEAQNRLWGCRYGQNANGDFVNEIYASALGDFAQWFLFDSTSMDSYVASVGADGPFTGAVNYKGMPLFFKENACFKIYGDYPENYQIVADAGTGLQRGCEKSLVVHGNTLYYRSLDGFCAYDGSSHVLIDAELNKENFENVVAGAVGAKLYFSAESEQEGHAGLYVYDTEKGLWHREDDTLLSYAVRKGNELYAVKTDGQMVAMRGTDGEVESEQIDFLAQTGPIGYSTPDSKYVSRLALRLAIDLEARLEIYIEYDSSGEWEFKGSIEGIGTRTFTLPIVPRNCDHFRIRFQGFGDVRIFGFSKVLEKGGAI